MIPRTITREHILRAIREIDGGGGGGDPGSGGPGSHLVEVEGRTYPPRAVIALANRYANGELLPASAFTGGDRAAAKFLADRGFAIVPADDRDPESARSRSWKVRDGTVAEKRMDRSMFRHNETAVPAGVRDFFSIGSMGVGERRDITLSLGVMQFQAHLEMVVEKHPRTRLVWKGDLSAHIRNTFPAWAKYFDEHREPAGNAPVLRITRTRSPARYRVDLVEVRHISATINLLSVTSREELKDRLGVTGSILRAGILKPAGFSSVCLLVTGGTAPAGSPRGSSFDGQVLRFAGGIDGSPDPLITGHEDDGNELLVFYRGRRNEYPGYGFRYLGRFAYYAHAPGIPGARPVRYLLFPLDVVPDRVTGELVPAPGTSRGRPIPGGEHTLVPEDPGLDPGIRLAAITVHGVTCAVCGFDFGAVYGPAGEGLIEIHRVAPSSPKKAGSPADPVSDLIPVCANCHRVIHREGGEKLAPGELREAFGPRTPGVP